MKALDTLTKGPKFIADIAVEVDLLRRFFTLQKQPTTYRKLRMLFNAINRAIEQDRIRRTNHPTPHHHLIEWVQDSLFKLLNGEIQNTNEPIELVISTVKLAEIRSVLDHFKKYPAIPLAARFMQMYQTAPPISRAQRLYKDLKTHLAKRSKKSDPLLPKLNQLIHALKNYTHSKTPSVGLSARTLRPLTEHLLKYFKIPQTLNGANSDKKHTPTPAGYYISPTDGGPPIVRRGDQPRPEKSKQRYHMEGRWYDLLKSPAKGFKALIYGPPGHGKSTMILDLTKYLSESFGYLFYAAIEEGPDTASFQDRKQKLAVNSPRFHYANCLPQDLSPYEFVVIDSISNANMKLTQIQQIVKAWPGVSFIFISHVNEKGTPLGGKGVEYLSDIKIKVERGIAHPLNRWGKATKFPIKLNGQSISDNFK